MPINNVLLRSIALLLSTGVLGACQSESQTASTVKFTAPSAVTQVRAIDMSKVRPQVQLANGANVAMQRGADNSWTGTINVQPNSTYFVTVTWIESMSQGDLELARWERNVEVGADGKQVNLGSGDYNYSADFDGDMVDNITERRNSTDPFVANDNNASPPEGDTGDSTAGSDPDQNTDQTTAQTPDQTPDQTDSQTPEQTTDDTTGGNTPDDNQDDSAGSSTGTAGSTSGDNGSDGGDGTNTNDDGTNPSLSTATVLIPRISPADAPSIDGKGAGLNGQNLLEGEWASAVQFDDNNELLLIDRLMVDVNANDEDGAPLRRWAAMHDGANLYVLVLSDDTGARHGDSIDAYEDDALELFIDADNSKLPVWGDADDFHYMIPLLMLNTKLPNNNIDGRIQPGPMSSDVSLDIEFHTGPGEGPAGIKIKKWEQDVYELAIPLAAAGIQAGLPFGFELQLDDDDDGAGRESKWGWHHPSRQNDTDTDLTYTNPSVMGTVLLAD